MGKASRAKQKRNQQRAVQQALMGRLRESIPDKQLKVVKRTPGPKVSVMLVDVAQPWLEEARTGDQQRIVIDIAVLAWNMALIPEPKRWEGMSPELAKKLSAPAAAILKDMIARKLSLYPEQRHTLLGHETWGSGGDMRVEVAYSLPPEEIADLAG